jgi:hypothetical protein
MKYTTIVNVKKRTITVEYEGHKGTAKCCPTDNFDIAVGTELALERAKVAKKTAEQSPARQGVMELIRALEKALPKGDIVVVGNGDKLTDEHKRFLASLIGINLDEGCDCANCAECEAEREAAYNDGYNDALAKVRELFGELD